MARTRISVLVLAAALLSGCEQVTVALGKLFFPERDHVAILEPGEFSLRTAEYTFEDSMHPTVRSDSNRLCFVLGENQELGSDKLDKIVELVMSTELTGSVLLDDGSKFIFERPSLTWNLEGKILGSKEHSACLLLKCNEKMEAGKRIQSITFSAALPIEAKGLYWVGKDPL